MKAFLFSLVCCVVLALGAPAFAQSLSGDYTVFLNNGSFILGPQTWTFNDDGTGSFTHPSGQDVAHTHGNAGNGQYVVEWTSPKGEDLTAFGAINRIDENFILLNVDPDALVWIFGSKY